MKRMKQTLLILIVVVSLATILISILDGSKTGVAIISFLNLCLASILLYVSFTPLENEVLVYEFKPVEYISAVRPLKEGSINRPLLENAGWFQVWSSPGWPGFFCRIRALVGCGGSIWNGRLHDRGSLCSQSDS